MCMSLPLFSFIAPPFGVVSPRGIYLKVKIPSYWYVHKRKTLRTQTFLPSVQFAGALRFSDDLCLWRNDMVQSGILPNNAISMFQSSGCPFQDGPNLLDAESPMCMLCGSSTDSSFVPGTGKDSTPRADEADEPPTFQLQFTMTTELFDAVDAYLIDGSKVSLTSQKYGYPIGTWDVSRITNFSSIFDYRRNPMLADFNEDLVGWNVSAALVFDRMFMGAAAFTTWYTAGVRSMTHMFDGAASFNGDLSRWETRRCENMSFMFRGASSFNSDLSKFDTSSLIDASYMFHSARSFQGKGLSGWNVERLYNMSSMFEEAISFQGDLSRWNVSLVSDMSKAFRFAVRWSSDISDWNIANVKTFTFSFSGAVSFNAKLSTWSISSNDLIGMVSCYPR
jgi:surface protein